MKIKRRTVQFQPHTRNLFLHVLTQCNLSCRHCYINPDQHGRQMLDEETLAKWLALFASRVQETNVIFLGGEPSLNPALPAAVREARRLGYASVTIDTNGFLFHDILEKVTPDEVDYLSFSLDGSTPEVNDPIRGPGVHEVCIGGVRRARARGFAVSVIFTVSRLNIEDLPRMPTLLLELGVERFFVQVIGIRGKPARHDEKTLQLSKEEWEEVVPPMAEAAAREGLHVTYPKVFLGLDEPFSCAGLVADNYFVFPNGRVYRCPLCEDFPLHSLEIAGGELRERPPIRESDLYGLEIPEGCVMNRILHPGNIAYDDRGLPLHRIACCMLKEEVRPTNG